MKRRIKNPVAKNSKRFNKSVVHLDRKKASKLGKTKHKKKKNRG